MPSSPAVIMRQRWALAAAGGRGGSRAGQAPFVAAVCRRRRWGRLFAVLRSIPGPPPPLAWLAAVSVGKASLPVSQRPHPPTQQQPGRYAAALLRCSRSTMTKPGLRLASTAAALPLPSSSLPLHTSTPALPCSP